MEIDNDYQVLLYQWQQRQIGALSCSHQQRICDRCFDHHMEKLLAELMCTYCEVWSTNTCHECYELSERYYALRCLDIQDRSMDNLRCGRCGQLANGCCPRAPRFTRCFCGGFHPNILDCQHSPIN